MAYYYTYQSSYHNLPNSTTPSSNPLQFASFQTQNPPYSHPNHVSNATYYTYQPPPPPPSPPPPDYSHSAHFINPYSFQPSTSPIFPYSSPQPQQFQNPDLNSHISSSPYSIPQPHNQTYPLTPTVPSHAAHINLNPTQFTNNIHHQIHKSQSIYTPTHAIQIPTQTQQFSLPFQQLHNPKIQSIPISSPVTNLTDPHISTINSSSSQIIVASTTIYGETSEIHTQLPCQSSHVQPPSSSYQQHQLPTVTQLFTGEPFSQPQLSLHHQQAQIPPFNSILEHQKALNDERFSEIMSALKSIQAAKNTAPPSESSSSPTQFQLQLPPPTSDPILELQDIDPGKEVQSNRDFVHQDMPSIKVNEPSELAHTDNHENRSIEEYSFVSLSPKHQFDRNDEEICDASTSATDKIYEIPLLSVGVFFHSVIKLDRLPNVEVGATTLKINWVDFAYLVFDKISDGTFMVDLHEVDGDIVRDWIVMSLSYAPCCCSPLFTMPHEQHEQGLLVVDDGKSAPSGVINVGTNHMSLLTQLDNHSFKLIDDFYQHFGFLTKRYLIGHDTVLIVAALEIQSAKTWWEVREGDNLYARKFSKQNNVVGILGSNKRDSGLWWAPAEGRECRLRIPMLPLSWSMHGESGIPLDVHHFICLADIFEPTGRFDEAMNLIENIVLALSQRGRLNILSNVDWIWKPLCQIFSEFSGGTELVVVDDGFYASTGDVKYHLRTSYDQRVARDFIYYLFQSQPTWKAREVTFVMGQLWLKLPWPPPRSNLEGKVL